MLTKSYKLISRKFFFFLLILSLFSLRASAYIDPGTGGMIVGSIWPYIPINKANN